MENTRSSYSVEEKMQIILDVLSHKKTIQKVAQEKGIAPTLISLWKKQAVEAMQSRFEPQPKGRKKSVPELSASVEKDMKATRNEARSAKIKASHLENALRDTRAKLASIESQVHALAASMGCKLVKERAPRGSRGPRKSRKG